MTQLIELAKSTGSTWLLVVVIGAILLHTLMPVLQDFLRKTRADRRADDTHQNTAQQNFVDQLMTRVRELEAQVATLTAQLLEAVRDGSHWRARAEAAASPHKQPDNKTQEEE